MTRILGGLCLVFSLVAAAAPLRAEDAPRPPQEKAAAPAGAAEVPAKPAPATVRLIPVPLPITGSVDTNVMQNVDRLLSDLKPEGPRPIFVFEFKSASGQTGEGSQFERAWSLARFLTSDKLSRVDTVAFVPGNLKGHALLVALACGRLVVSPDSELGDAGAGEKFIDATVQRNYVDIAERRQLIPSAVVLGMLEKRNGVYKVQGSDSVRYALAEDLDKLKKETAVVSETTVIPPGEVGIFSGRDLRLKWGFASHLATDRHELATALQISPQALQDDPSAGRGWQAVRIEVRGIIHRELVSWVTKAIDERLKAENVNLIFFVIDSPGGSLDLSLSLANRISELEPSRVRTVAFVQNQALGDAAVIALACDQLVMADNAKLGGFGDAAIDDKQKASARESLVALANRKQRNWSLLVSMIDDSLTVHRYVRKGTGAVRFLCDEELDTLHDRDAWERGGAIETQRGLTGHEAEQMKLAGFLANNTDELRQLYNLEQEPEAIQPSWAHVFIERLASPRIAGVLIFVAWFALMIEFMTPGFTGAGFVSGVCFLLYFWSQFLHGTAGWLEILLFVAGLACVAVELLAMPGFGILGIGGGLMIVASIILASQTFVIPRNTYQLEQLPGSMFMVVAAGSGAILSLALMRRYLPHAPVFRRLMLSAPSADLQLELEQREQLANYSHLLGQVGYATTPLVPAGKARFGNETINVLSDGELLERGTEIYVTEAVGNRVVVRQRGK